eukprot:GHVT01031725.1.p1 GENE.GHVT01031725.1~~GHVT01031725.1.p1  ORF type:complete len:631 (+),score=69.41 GHVT01031725.1:552-2444(+)
MAARCVLSVLFLFTFAFFSAGVAGGKHFGSVEVAPLQAKVVPTPTTRCRQVPKQIFGSCHRFEEKNVTKPCPVVLTTNHCGFQPRNTTETCYKNVTVVEPGPCPESPRETKCTFVERLVPKTCFSSRLVNVTHPCDGHQPSRPRPSAEEVGGRVNLECLQHSSQETSRPYSQDTPQTFIPLGGGRNSTRKGDVVLPGHWRMLRRRRSNAFRSAVTPDEVIHPHQDVDGQSLHGTSQVHNRCRLPTADAADTNCMQVVMAMESYDCSESGSQDVCQNVSVSYEDICYRDEFQVEYDCPEFKYKTVCDFAPRVFYGALPPHSQDPGQPIIIAPPANAPPQAPSAPPPDARRHQRHHPHRHHPNNRHLEVSHMEKMPRHSSHDDHSQTFVGTYTRPHHLPPITAMRKLQRLKGSSNDAKHQPPPKVQLPAPPPGACSPPHCDVRFPEPICKKVPYKVPKKCTRPAYQEPYSCNKTKLEERCTKRKTVIHRTCNRRSATLIPIPCHVRTVPLCAPETLAVARLHADFDSSSAIHRAMTAARPEKKAAHPGRLSPGQQAACQRQLSAKSTANSSISEELDTQLQQQLCTTEREVVDEFACPVKVVEKVCEDFVGNDSSHPDGTSTCITVRLAGYV